MGRQIDWPSLDVFCALEGIDDAELLIRQLLTLRDYIAAQPTG